MDKAFTVQKFNVFFLARLDFSKGKKYMISDLTSIFVARYFSTFEDQTFICKGIL